MEEMLDGVNLVVSGIVGVISSILGAILYASLGKYLGKFSEKRRNSRLDKLKSEAELLEKVRKNSSTITIYCFRNLFYVMALSAVASTFSFLTMVDYFVGSILSVSMWVAIALVGFNVLSTLNKLANYETYANDLNAEIEQLSVASKS
ncbi:hypothetical protein QNE95_004290 [Vibrio vulnificus]|uniref:hypothetical protein n=1 Tax=Vibrio vulnificus TaxID=672 RepID=UPI001022C3C0|nr:hypothetical protein [Vibrio vulnificus]EGQ7993492.1 hypothetical protein [Vibrio vulnificus]EGR0102507.1 hypothetical protein [Vibrio vulnificus]EGS1997743.1 hypothetical protein [Vibrio vulnificus]EHK9068821.1 hypothetical protein [Vibrio vulnificus]EHV2843460.1 hypothetical protein [Vibrio vulnificus]